MGYARPDTQLNELANTAPTIGVGSTFWQTIFDRRGSSSEEFPNNRIVVCCVLLVVIPTVARADFSSRHFSISI